jgi:hypothetical protein
MIEAPSTMPKVGGAPVDSKPAELDCYSIDVFCERHSISRGTYYNMKEAKTHPRETRAMGRVLISKEAAAEWRTRQ